MKEAGQYTADLARGMPEDSIGGRIVARRYLSQTVFVASAIAPDGDDDRECGRRQKMGVMQKRSTVGRQLTETCYSGGW
jgi:hypothetical protein